MREGLRHWDETGELPQRKQPARLTRAMVTQAPPGITVRETWLTWEPAAERRYGCLWNFSIRLSIDLTNGKRVAIVGDDCTASIKPTDMMTHRLCITLHNMRINEGPVAHRADLRGAADVRLVAPHDHQAWKEPLPTRLRAEVELVGSLRRWTKRLLVDLVWSPNSEYAVRWAGYGEGEPEDVTTAAAELAAAEERIRLREQGDDAGTTATGNWSDLACRVPGE